jgi:hypothetical protein
MSMPIGLTSRESVRAEHEARRERLTRAWPHPRRAGSDDTGARADEYGVGHGLRYLAPVLARLTARRHHRHA